MGLLQLPMLQEKGWQRGAFGLAMAIQNLYGVLHNPSLEPLLIPLAGNSQSGRQQTHFEQTFTEALREALRHRSFVLLISGFFVCGFQVAFITAHFPAYLGDLGINAKYAVIALAAIGFFNIGGRDCLL